MLGVVFEPDLNFLSLYRQVNQGGLPLLVMGADESCNFRRRRQNGENVMPPATNPITGLSRATSAATNHGKNSQTTANRRKTKIHFAWNPTQQLETKVPLTTVGGPSPPLSTPPSFFQQSPAQKPFPVRFKWILCCMWKAWRAPIRLTTATCVPTTFGGSDAW